ncbi:MAG TPA: Cache 3/Cache 2 fusion domain-containing protein [Candidatus Kryptonia bacterium]|nr:Cache 3/Cache 2 fusion domain-containing protein [Candidatus Kryptonia bacterium]
MRKIAFLGLLAAACLAASALLPGSAGAQDAAAKVKASMAALKAATAKLGAPKLEGKDKVGDKDVPALYFGTAKINNDYTVVDEVVKQHGGTATLFVKSGDEYVRVSTNVKKPDGSRATATILDPKGKAIAAINADQAFYGDVDILGKLYTTGYEPIHDGANKVIGIYYVGYLKE